MKVSVFGTGRMGRELVRFLSSSVDGLMWASRSIARVKQLVAEIGSGIHPATYEEALEADVLIPTMWFRDLARWAEGVHPRLEGSILVHQSV